MKQMFLVLMLAALFAGASFAQAAEEVFDVEIAPPEGIAMPEADAFYFQGAPEPPPPPPPGASIRMVGDKTSYLGVGVQDIEPERGKELKLSDVHGVEVTRVEEDSPAAKAGLKPGDVVLEYNGQRVEGTQQFVRLVRETPAERQVKLVVSRGGATQSVTATIGVRKNMKVVFQRRMGANGEMGPQWQQNMERLQSELGGMRMRMPDMPQPFMAWRSGAMGVEAESIGSQLAGFFGVKKGVLVRSVNKDSAAEKAGILAGDVITKVDNQEVAAPSEITERIRALGEKKTFGVTLVRNHKEQTVNVTIEPRREGEDARPRRIIAPKVKELRHQFVTTHAAPLL